MTWGSLLTPVLLHKHAIYVQSEGCLFRIMYGCTDVWVYGVTWMRRKSWMRVVGSFSDIKKVTWSKWSFAVACLLAFAYVKLEMRSLSLSSPLSPCFFFVYGWPPVPWCGSSARSRSHSRPPVRHCPFLYMIPLSTSMVQTWTGALVYLFFLCRLCGVFIPFCPFFSSLLLLSNSIQQTWQHQHRLDHLDQPKQTSSYDTLFFLVCCASDR